MIIQKIIISLEMFNLLLSRIQEEHLPFSVTPGNQYRDAQGNIFQSTLVETESPYFFQTVLSELYSTVLNPIDN
jgi:hypothetical protein